VVGGRNGARQTAAVLRCQIDRSADNGTYHWRLSTQNGRVVAVSGDCYPDYGRCLAAFEETCRSAGDLVGTVRHTDDGAGWTWQARDPGGRRLARSARAYERYATCQSAADRFRVLLAAFVAAGRPGWHAAG
jgi:hypothetical protein